MLFNDALNTFYLRLYGRKEMFYLTTHSTHFIYVYMEGKTCFVYLFIIIIIIIIIIINRDYYPRVFVYRQYHVLGIKIVLCEPLGSIIHYFLFPIHDTADTQRHEGNNLFII